MFFQMKTDSAQHVDNISVAVEAIENLDIKEVEQQPLKRVIAFN